MKSCILYWFTRRLFAIFFLLIFSPSTNHSVVSSAICPEECSCSLYVIDCSNRLLTTVPTTNISYNARKFVLSVNHLTIIEDETFSELINLQELRLNHNTIYTLKPLAFRGLNHLMELSLKNNRLVDISAIHKLRLADLSENHIRILPDLGNLASLEKLILTGNPIHLIFSSNPPSSLYYLDIKYADLSFIPRLILSHNEIQTIDWGPSDQHIRLQTLDLSYNQLPILENFTHLDVLSNLDLNLENNQIQHISQSAFINQGHFILRLGNNHLVSILSSSLPLLSRTIYLDPNPWHCDCESTALRRWLLLSGVQLYQCMKPSNFRNRSLVSLRESELCPDVFGDFEPSWDISFNETNNASNKGGDMVFGQITGAAPAAVVWDVVFMPTDRSARSSGDEPSIAEVIAGVYHVDLSSNRIKSISAQSFTFCIFIKELNLENNQIQHISQSAFINQGHFILRLGNNHLVSILPSSLPLLSRTVYLDPNPWHCDCESVSEQKRVEQWEEKRQQQQQQRQQLATAPTAQPQMTFICSNCNRTCLSRIGLFSHSRSCTPKN
ncbi:leucine-rich repeat-containing protein 15-like [Strongylocentrotus purpuratus]|uniref:Uncharacterized protein n=1 Tax=Strongylocentrotus purpuratus TaxID=7668 RepID=A0A7M7PST2_STRPU|nr:leucine-rich repeat-containing protein 15-like [Strongylocentrotus purpuratus]